VTASEEIADTSKKGVVEFDAAAAQAGYNYVVYEHCRAEIVDMQGNVIHKWKHRKCFRWGKTALLPDGSLITEGQLTAATPKNRYGRFMARLTMASKVVWKVPAPVHHAAISIPGDKFLTLTLRKRGVPTIYGPKVRIVDNGIATYNNNGDLIEEISLFDILDKPSDLFSFQPVKPNDLYFKKASDLLHANSIELMEHSSLSASSPIYRAGNLLICVRNQDTIAILDKSKKTLLWAWGRGELMQPHDARLLESGNILVFDNGAVRDYSRVVEVDPRTNRIVWTYQDDPPERFFSITQGANQRLQNGNTLITESTEGHVFEITPAGQKVWEFWAPHFTEKKQRLHIVMALRVSSESLKAILAGKHR
jgi:hypothetical protein